MKRKALKILGCVLFVAVVIGALNFLFYMNFYDSEKTEFKKNQNNYYTVVNYLLTLNLKPTDGKVTLGVDSYKGVMKLYDCGDDGRNLKLTKNVYNALRQIDDSFIDMGYSLDAIRIKDGKISFDVIDGRYSLVYVIDESKRISSILEEMFKEKRKTMKADKNWYHSFPR